MKNELSTPKTCPCGCQTPLPMIAGKRRLVCKSFWQSLPDSLRSVITSPGISPEEKRAGIREMLSRAHKAAEKHTAPEQLSLL